MTRPMDESELRKYIAAFADGELDVEQNLRVLEYLAMHPAATRRAVHQQQLRQAVKRHITDSTPDMPDELVASIEKMAAEDSPVVGRIAPTGAGRAEAWWSRVAAVVAILATAGLVGSAVMWQRTSSRLEQTATRLAVLQEQIESTPRVVRAGWTLPRDRQEVLASRHVDCARAIERLMNHSKYPTDVAEAPAAIAEYLGAQPENPLDLTPLGYAFKGLGECRAPGSKSLHLVYQSTDRNAHDDALSLWITPFEGQYDIREGIPYAGAAPDTDHPVVYWRRGGLVFILAGDSMKQVESAAMRMALRS